MPLARQRLGEDLSADSRFERRKVIGLVDKKLISKLNRRKHAYGGPEMARICICGTYALVSRELHVPQLSRNASA